MKRRISRKNFAPCGAPRRLSAALMALFCSGVFSAGWIRRKS
jgi:hypothetical protein